MAQEKAVVSQKPKEGWKHTFQEYEQLKRLPLCDKVLRAEQLILYALKSHHVPCVSCSWGKDSMTLLHLVRKFCKNAFVMFNNTGVQYPQNLQYRDRMLEEWSIENYIENKPIKSFWKCVREYGYPQSRQMGRHKQAKKKGGFGNQRTPRCCYYTKEKPARNAIKKHGIDLNFIGLQASESMVRRLSFLREGEMFQSKSYGCTLVRPLMIWSDKDVWAYHKQEAIPPNPLYDLMERNGCMPCTGFTGWQEVMAKANPKLYEFVSREMGQPLLDCDLFTGGLT